MYIDMGNIFLEKFFLFYCFLSSFLCLHKETEPKKVHPAKPLLTESVRSPRKNPLAIKLAALKQNCSLIGFFLSSLTVFEGTPFYVLKLATEEKSHDDFCDI